MTDWHRPAPLCHDAWSALARPTLFRRRSTSGARAATNNPTWVEPWPRDRREVFRAPKVPTHTLALATI